MLIALVPLVPMSSVYPSGLALAAISAPMLPPMPERLSIATDWPQASARLGPAVRASTSTTLPVGNGATMLIGRSA
jgi:hypothetical protein